jgi:enoyl-CoA hydratase/carnithine racemase
MEATRVLTEMRGATLRVAMNRPEKKNALTLDMYERLIAAFAQASADDAVRVLVITGAPGVFTAGNDLGDFMKSPPTGADSPVSRFLQTIVEFDKPLIAAVDGVAIGLGTTMLLHCDQVIATDRARFHMPFTKLGLVPEAASSVLFPALVGHQRAASWLLFAQPFDAKEAHGAGLVSRVVAPNELEQVADALAVEVAALPKEAVRLTKRLLKQGMAAAVKEALAREGALFMERLGSPETMEALMSFMTKR